jgi:amylosucrase
MSRKKAARARKSKIRNQVEHAAEETVTMETEEMTGQEAAGQESLADEQKTAETAKPETEVKEAVMAEEKTGEAEKIEEKQEKPEKESAPAEEKTAEPELAEEEKSRQEEVYRRRFNRHFDELKWLYTELYGNDSMFAELCDNLHRFYEERNQDLKASDLRREENPGWYKQNDMLGMMLYIDNFAGDIKGVESRLDYLEKSNVNYIHLMPFLETPKGRSDGGYAVSDFRKVQEKLGTMEDLESLTAACRKKNMNVCMDFVMNHTSEDHEWAKRARQGDGEYMSRYFFYDNDAIPQQYERTVPQVFPTTAPGNFTWLDDIKHYVMTTFYPYQWDLNYKNPRVFNEMMYNFLFLANKGIDVIRIDAVPYIWKELNTDCRNLPRVHTIVRMMRMIGEIVCPGILLLGEVVMEPEKVVPYFGTVEKPECHMLYNVTTMATTWHTVATRDVRLLKRQLDIVNNLPKEYVFLNYLRCHDDIGWGLDYPTLELEGIHERSHKQYLNDYFRGYTGNSTSRGVLYNEDLVLGDARFCGTTASMCGIEKAGFEEDAQAMEKAIQMDVMLHAYMFMQSGIPVLYSGDEMGQVNDYSYKEDPDKAEDSRYIHRGAMRWDLAENITDPETVEGKMFQRLNRLEEIRKSEKVFVTNANVWTVETWEQGVLCIGRYFEGEKLFGLFNFSEYDKIAWINEIDGNYVDLISGEAIQPAGVHIQPFGFYYLKRQA